MRFSGIWAKVHDFKHSCCPNITWFCLGSLLIIRASGNISEGEELTINKIEQAKPLIDRNIHLKDRGINCNCIRHQIEAKKGPLYTPINRCLAEQMSIKELEELVQGLQEKLRKANLLCVLEIFRDVVYVCKLMKDWYLFGKLTVEFMRKHVESYILDYKCIIFVYSHILADLLEHTNDQSIRETHEATCRLFRMLFDNDDKVFVHYDNIYRVVAVQLTCLASKFEYS